MKRGLLWISLGLFLLLLSLAQAKVISYNIAIPIQTHDPVIVITYLENPIIIEEYSLSYAKEIDGVSALIPSVSYVSDGIGDDNYDCQIPFNIPTPDMCRGKEFNFTMNGFLFNDNYTFWARTRDGDNNIIEFYMNFTILAPGVKPFLESHKIRFDSSKKFGMAKQNPVEINISFNPFAPIETCYWAFYNRETGLKNRLELASSNDDFKDLYYYVMASYPNNNLSPSDSVNLQNPEFKHDLLDFSSIPYSEDDLEKIFIICNETDPSLIHFGIFDLGFDTTIPVFEEASFSKPLINDVSYPNTNLNITTDDATVCLIENVAYPNNNIYNLPESWFDFNSVHNYTKEHVYPLSFLRAMSISPSNYTFSIICENRAGNFSKKINRTLKIDIEYDIRIKSNTELYQKDKSIELSVETNIESQCSYSSSADSLSGVFVSHPSSGSVIHDAVVSVNDEKKYDFEILCTERTYSNKLLLSVVIDSVARKNLKDKHAL